MLTTSHPAGGLAAASKRHSGKKTGRRGKERWGRGRQIGSRKNTPGEARLVCWGRVEGRWGETTRVLARRICCACGGLLELQRAIGKLEGEASSGWQLLLFREGKGCSACACAGRTARAVHSMRQVRQLAAKAAASGSTWHAGHRLGWGHALGPQAQVRWRLVGAPCPSTPQASAGRLCLCSAAAWWRTRPHTLCMRCAQASRTVAALPPASPVRWNSSRVQGLISAGRGGGLPGGWVRAGLG